MSERFSKSKAVILTEYKGLTVSEIADLRRLLKGIGVEYKVYKNTLSAIAAKGTPVEQAAEMFVGPTGIAFGFEDPVAAAKQLLDYAAKNDKFKVKSGIFEGRVYTTDDIKAISTLPPKNILLGMLAGAMNAPASKLAGALNATLTRFVYAMEALKTRKQSASSD